MMKMSLRYGVLLSSVGIITLAAATAMAAEGASSSVTLDPNAPPALIDDIVGTPSTTAPTAVVVQESDKALEQVQPVTPVITAPKATSAPVVAKPVVTTPKVETPKVDTPKRVEPPKVEAPSVAVPAPVAEPKMAKPKKAAAKKASNKSTTAKPVEAATPVGVESGVAVAAPEPSKAQDIINALVASDDKNLDADLPLSAALRESYVNNPTLRAARAEVKATYEQLPQALAGWQPSIGASGSVTYSSVDTDVSDSENGTVKSAGLSLSQPLYRGGRTVAGTSAARALIDAQLASLASSERQILFNTAQAYMDVIKAQATVKVNEKNRDVIARQLKATQDRFRVGDVTRTDVSQSEFRLAQAEADLTTSIGALRSARALFEQLVGQPAGHLALPSPMFRFPASVDDAVTMAETYNPDVIAAMARHEAAKDNVNVVFGELLPDVSLGASTAMSRDPVGAAYDDQTSTSLGVTVTMPLYEGGAVRSRVRQAKYTANQLYLKILEARRSAREESVRAWENLAAARGELLSREAQVRAAEVARDGVHQEADLGERTILDALDADTEVRDAQVALISAKRNEVVAQFALASSLGLLVPGNVGIETPVFDFDSYAKGVVGRILSTSVQVEDESGH